MYEGNKDLYGNDINTDIGGNRYIDDFHGEGGRTYLDQSPSYGDGSSTSGSAYEPYCDDSCEAQPGYGGAPGAGSIRSYDGMGPLRKALLVGLMLGLVFWLISSTFGLVAPSHLAFWPGMAIGFVWSFGIVRTMKLVVFCTVVGGVLFVLIPMYFSRSVAEVTKDPKELKQRISATDTARPGIRGRAKSKTGGRASPDISATNRQTPTAGVPGSTEPAPSIIEGVVSTSKGAAQQLDQVFTPTSDPGADEEPIRIWTDKSGKYSVKAQLIGYENGLLHLKREDGTIVRVPLLKISLEDREHLQAWIKATK